MKVFALLALATIACVQRNLCGTSCSFPPPCARVHPGSVLFVGSVLNAGPVLTTDNETYRNVSFRVDEIFAGLAPSIKEVVVTTQGSWLQKGHTYLIDAARGNDNRLSLMICGASGEVTDNFAADVLEYLRQRAQGKTKTSLSVDVVDQHELVPDVDVTINGPAGQLTGRTGADGVATFNGIKPARYSVAAALAHYHLDPEQQANADKMVDVVQGACSNARIAIRSDAGIGGFVADAKGVPMPFLNLELVSAPENASQKISLNKPFFEAKTDADGRFSFESVSPGSYLLGSNIIGLSTSPVPPAYYPGQRNRNGAYPIEVKLGETVTNLRFTMPDFGAPREIQVCVVDETGMPVASAAIASDFNREGTDFARLGEQLTTNAAGCAIAHGYSLAQYSIHAVLRPPGTDFRQIRLSDSLVIDPGEEPVRQVFVLKKPFGPRKAAQ